MRMRRMYFGIRGRGASIGAFVLVVGCGAGVADAEAPARDSSPRATMERAMELMGAGRTGPGEELMREAIRGADNDGDLGDAYWFAWQMARHDSADWSEERRLAWFDIAETALNRRDPNAPQWLILDVPNYIQMLCEKETILTRLGRMGEGFTVQRKAEALARRHWDGLVHGRDMNRWSSLQRGIWLHVLLDRASQQGLSGDIRGAEDSYLAGLTLLSDHQRSDPAYTNFRSRIHNNYGVFLGLIGRDEEEDRHHREALKYRNPGTPNAIVESNELRQESLRNGPSPDLWQRLLALADQLETERRWDSSWAARRRAASMMYDLGENEKAEALFATVVAGSRRRSYGLEMADAFYWRAKARGRAGHEGAEGDFVASLDQYRRMGAKIFECRVYHAYAEFLGRNGRVEEALRAVHEALRMMRGMGLVHLQPESLALKAEMLARAGQVPAADEVWREALRLAQDTRGYSPHRHLAVRMSYLRHLARCGRDAALSEERERTGAWVAASGLTEFQAKSFLEFNPEDHRAGANPTPPVWSPVVIQPIYTATHTQPGEPAESWFWLLNPAAHERNGLLRVKGHGALSWSSETGSIVEVLVEDGGAPVILEKTIALPAEGARAVRLVHTQPPASGFCRIAVEWEGEGAREAEWNLAGDADRHRVQATYHQHFAHQNAFFGVMAYHEIGLRGGEIGLNFRVRGQVPCRVEIYDAERQTLLAVDADADGDFSGVGDILAMDADINGYPDADRAPLPLLLQFLPLTGGRYDQPLDLTLEIWIEGEWAPIGTTRLIPAPTGE